MDHQLTPLEQGQFLVTIDNYIFKCYDGYQGIDDREMLGRMLEWQTILNETVDKDEAFSAGYNLYEYTSWLLKYREYVTLPATLSHYFEKQEPVMEVDFDNLPF